MIEITVHKICEELHREHQVRAKQNVSYNFKTLCFWASKTHITVQPTTVQFCLSATVSTYPSPASGKEVFSSEETDHHVAQQDSHLGAAHHQPAVGARDHSSTQTPRQGQIPGPEHTGDHSCLRTSDMFSGKKKKLTTNKKKSLPRGK